jgi:hypothetical protein
MIDNRLETFQEDRTVVFITTDVLDRRRWSHLLENDPNLILKWCITTQMEVKALCVETEEDVWCFR